VTYVMMEHWKKMPGLVLLLMALIPCLAEADVTVVGLFKGRAVVSVDGCHYTLKVGQSSPEGVKLISADSEAAVLEIRGKRGRYPLGRHISSHYQAAKKAEVRIVRDRHGMFKTPGTINGRPVEFLVDTGAGAVAMNAGHARSLGLSWRWTGTPIQVSTASGVATAYRITLKRVRVGPVELRDVDAWVHETDDFPQEILLGMSFLKRLEMVHKGNVLLLRSTR